MLNKEDILSLKLSSRFCRRKQRDLPDIKAIVEECCAGLGMNAPELICCESLTRSFSAFHLMGEPYLIYDACLIEALYIYDLILASGAKQQDMDKFFYKLFGEECIRNRDLVHALYFAGKYRGMKYSFDLDEDAYGHVKSQIACQSYFLVGHELGHLKLKEPNSEGIPTGYKQFVRGAIGAMTKRGMEEQKQTIAEYASDRANYFPVTHAPQTLDEYLGMLMANRKFLDFLEECYCDFVGFKLLVEEYRSPDVSVNAISSALNYLITQETIRSDLNDGLRNAKNVFREAKDTMFYSVQRVMMLLLTLEMNQLKDIERAFGEIHDRSQLTDRLGTFIQGLPDEEAVDRVSEADLPNIDRDRLENALMQEFYYCSVSS